MERRIGLGVRGVGLGALVDEEVDEFRVPAVGGVVEKRQALSVTGFDELRRFFDHRLDGRDIALAEQVEDLLGPGRGGQRQEKQ